MDQSAKYLDAENSASIVRSFRNSERKLILLDYDGTLVPFSCDPSKALPDDDLMHLLHSLSVVDKLDLVIISGRARDFLQKIFGNLRASLFAEHGAIFRIGGKWDSLKSDISWKDEVSAIMREAAGNTPGSSIEVKQNSLVWHYRKSDSELGEKGASELTGNLSAVCNRNNLSIMKGIKIVEVKPSGYNKGTAITSFFNCDNYDFILSAGDDVTDEDLFNALPERAVKIHIGKIPDTPGYTVRNSYEFISFLKTLRTG